MSKKYEKEKDDIELNSFIISGNILYPDSYTALLSFKATNHVNGELETYTIWRPNGQTINESGFKNTIESISYKFSIALYPIPVETMK